MGTEGVYTHTVAYERDAACPMCSAGVPFSVRSTDTLQQACAPEASLPRLHLCKTQGVAGKLVFCRPENCWAPAYIDQRGDLRYA